MKRIAMMAIALIAAIGLLSAAGSWSLEDGTLGTDMTKQSATMNVSLNLSGNGENQETETITIGFSKTAVNTGGDTPDVKDSAILTDNGNLQGTLSGDNVRYIYWKIASPSSLKIWLDYPAEMTGGTNNNNKLSWTITTTASAGANNGTAIGDGSSKEENGYLVLDRSTLSNFKYGTVGCQQLNITTASYSEAAIDSYSADLILKIASV